jgi:hypothetical protein
MSEIEELDLIVEALKRVQEKRLRIIELANSRPIKHGDFDPDVLSDMVEEVNAATQEAAAYGAHTLQAVDSLLRVPGRPANLDLRPLTDEDIEAATQF